MRYVVIALLLLGGCKSTFSDRIAECSKKGGTLVRVWVEGKSDYRCYTMEEMK